eukprot:2966988-Rhodomonas_salina.1
MARLVAVMRPDERVAVEKCYALDMNRADTPKNVDGDQTWDWGGGPEFVLAETVARADLEGAAVALRGAAEEVWNNRLASVSVSLSLSLCLCLCLCLSVSVFISVSVIISRGLSVSVFCSPFLSLSLPPSLPPSRHVHTSLPSLPCSPPLSSSSPSPASFSPSPSPPPPPHPPFLTGDPGAELAGVGAQVRGQRRRGGGAPGPPLGRHSHRPQPRHGTPWSWTTLASRIMMGEGEEEGGEAG